MKIGLDIMGGDYAPHSTLHGALLASKQLSTDEKIVLIGDSNVAKEILQQNNAELSLFEFIRKSSPSSSTNISGVTPTSEIDFPDGR